MNPLSIFAVLMVIGFAWLLTTSLKRGEFRFKSRGSMGHTELRIIKRDERPGMFWALVVFFAGLMAYVGSLAFVE